MNCSKEYWGVEFSPEEISAARKRKGLLSLELELSRACNLGCIYCYASSGESLPYEISLEEIHNVIDEAAALGARKVVILGGGEPLLYKDLFNVIDFIKGRDMEADLFTNGVLMSRQTASMLYEREVSVSIKMNSRKPEVQDMLANRPGTFKAIEQGLNNLLNAGYPENGRKLGIETIICRQNYEELPELWRWARKKNIIPYFEIMTSQGRAAEHSELEVTSIEIKRLFEELASIDRKEFERVWICHPPLAASQCARHEYSCTVTASGDVHPCPGVSISVGNIRNNSLADILSMSPVVEDLRNIRSKIHGKCASCDLAYRCYGCRGQAYQVTGDYLASDPLCWLNGSE